MRSGAVVAAAALAAAGCHSSGLLLLRGVVRAAGPARPEPLGGVTVQCRDGRDGAPGYSRVTTRDDGAYEIQHRYSGTRLPGLEPKGGDVYVEFFAPGYLRRLVKVGGGKEPGVERRTSGPFTRIDVTLEPEPAARRGGP